MTLLPNPYRHAQKAPEIGNDIPFPGVDAARAEGLVERCPKHTETPLKSMPELAQAAGAASFHIKDESTRMGLGSFKATGAAYVIATHAAETEKTNGTPIEQALNGRTYVTASAGNHGMSVAAGAKLFGAKAVIYLAKTVPAAFADRLRALGAEVRIEGGDYEASMTAAASAANTEGMMLLSDSSWQGYTEQPHLLMEGYLIVAAEMVRQMKEAPTHLFLQAGVGGLAGALAAFARKTWGDEVAIIVVEPVHAPALIESIRAGKSVFADGPVSNMGRLDCKEPSLIALKGLARDADYFVTISDEAAQAATDKLATLGMQSTPSGVAGIAAALDPEIAKASGINSNSRILTILSEGADS